jgi:hypothetical protein
MRSFSALRANSYYPGQYPARIHPALNSLFDEFCGTLARLVAYVGALALLAIGAIYLWDQLPVDEAHAPAARAGWSAASRAYPAFAVSQFDSRDKTASYEILRHPEGGRKDIFRWAAQGEKPIAELEIYRPGGEFSGSGPALAEIAERMDPVGARELETAGVIDSKFGPVTLLRLARTTDEARSCLGFIKRFGDPDLRISGWSCQSETLPARRAAIGCILSRLILLTAVNEPKLAELFARAELKRGSCAANVTADWVTEADNPRLRGTF